MQFQILINISRISPIIYIICIFFFSFFPFGNVLKLLFHDFFYIVYIISF